MLNIYLVPKRQSGYIPTEKQIKRWLIELKSAELAQDLNHQIDLKLEQFHVTKELCLEFASGLNVYHLYNQDAHDDLMPAELSFEALSLNITSHATLLPLDEMEFEAICPQCEDQILELDLDIAIAKLDLFPLSKIQVSCLSCQDEWPLKSVVFEPEMSFAKFWIRLQQSASTRLNHTVIKAWENSLGCELLQLNAQFDDCEPFESNWHPEFSVEATPCSSQGRKAYRQARWAKKQPKKQSGGKLASHSNRKSKNSKRMKSTDQIRNRF